MKNIIAAIFIIQLAALNIAVFYFGGIQRYGSPAEFRARQTEIAEARRDSLRQLQMETPAPENMGDSTMYDLGNHIGLFERMKKREAEIHQIQTMIDSLERERAVLEQLRETVSRREELLNAARERNASDNIAGLAAVFEVMKPPEAIPVMLEMDDTLAVSILARMESRNSAKLLGALALADTAKAVRLSRLMAKTGTPGGK